MRGDGVKTLSVSQLPDLAGVVSTPGCQMIPAKKAAGFVLLLSDWLSVTCLSVIGSPVGGEVHAINLLQVSLQENDTPSRPKVPHPAEGVQPSDRERVTTKYKKLLKQTQLADVCLPSGSQ